MVHGVLGSDLTRNVASLEHNQRKNFSAKGITRSSGSNLRGNSNTHDERRKEYFKIGHGESGEPLVEKASPPPVHSGKSEEFQKLRRSKKDKGLKKLKHLH